VHDDIYIQQFHDKIQPENVVVALVRAGALLVGYELAKYSIVDGVKGFFLPSWGDHDPSSSEQYEHEVLVLGRNKFEASRNWLVKMEALTQRQADAFDAIRAHRHEIAHDLVRFLVDPAFEVSVERLTELYGITRSLDRFWGGVSVDVDPDFDGVDVDRDSIVGGASLLLAHLFRIAGLETDPEPTSESP